MISTGSFPKSLVGGKKKTNAKQNKKTGKNNGRSGA